MALGIRYVGIGTADALAFHLKGVEPLFTITEEKLLEIEGVGTKVASSLVAHFKERDHVEEVRDLLSLGVTPKTINIEAMEGSFFFGKSFVITGTLTSLSRPEAQEAIKERGGKVSESLSKKTDYLIVGQAAGSKLEKAKKFGVPILDEATFLSKL